MGDNFLSGFAIGFIACCVVFFCIWIHVNDPKSDEKPKKTYKELYRENLTHFLFNDEKKSWALQKLEDVLDEKFSEAEDKEKFLIDLIKP